MKKIIVGNLKTNMTMDQIGDYILTLGNFLNTEHKIIICPSYIYIPFFINNSFELGAQDVSMYKNGNCTGDISALQLRSTNVKYVIIGHSERRANYNETDNIINEKIIVALENGLKPIICIGESKEEKLSTNTEFVLRQNILNSLKNIDKQLLSNIIIAYEPIWAIGTGITPTSNEIDEISLFIKDIVKSAYKCDIKVLYGGSVNKKNISKLTSLVNTDGFLIGEVSADPVEFGEIINCL